MTAKVAKKPAEAIGADLYDICPAVPYNTKDLDWTNAQSRSSIEMNNKDYRPKLLDKAAPVAGADVVFVGFPVWWYREPSIIDSFLEAYDFTGKKIVPFATSGGSDIGEEAPARMAEISGAEVLLYFVNRVSVKSEKLFPVFGSGIPFFRIGAWTALTLLKIFFL